MIKTHQIYLKTVTFMVIIRQEERTSEIEKNARKRRRKGARKSEKEREERGRKLSKREKEVGRKRKREKASKHLVTMERC